MLQGHDDAVFFTPPTRLQATAGDTTAKGWNRETQDCVTALQGHGAPVCTVLATASGGETATANVLHLGSVHRCFFFCSASCKGTAAMA